ALLSSLPQLGVKGEDLYSIQGTPPNLFYEVKGDAFAPRNPQALKIDFLERPPFFQVSPTHKARTWLLDPPAPKVEPPEHIRALREKGVNRLDGWARKAAGGPGPHRTVRPQAPSLYRGGQGVLPHLPGGDLRPGGGVGLRQDHHRPGHHPHPPHRRGQSDL